MERVEDILTAGQEDFTGEEIIARLNEAGYKIESTDACNPEEYMRGFTDGRENGLRHNISIVSADSGNVRIEALRAAARIVVALNNAEQHPDHQFRWAAETTFEVAEQFAAWLETGER